VSSLAVNLWICGAAATCCWLASALTREYSWTDRVWSILPVVYVWVFAARAGDLRATLVAVLVSAWGVRLTVNFARRGGYAPGGEDYRWAILRARLPGWRFAVFNLGFIAVYQNALLLAITLPVRTITDHPRPLGVTDAAAALAFVVLLAGETVADQQRWDFHRTHPEGGVLRTGLFAYCRHPNYFCEIAQWWVVLAFTVIAAGTPWLATAVGAVALTVLFVGSTTFTEQISTQRHPEYAEYRRSTPMLVPRPRRRSDRRR
jgi:steroid 5-alpha reductase family enzyme